MQLKINTSIRKSVVTIELETTNFCNIENLMLDQFGEPVYVHEHIYQDDFPVSIHKKIRTNFKVKVKFDGSGSDEKMAKAALAANEFIDYLKDNVPEFMDKWMSEKQDIDIKAGTEFVDILNHSHIH